MSLGVRISWWVNEVTPNSHVTISQKVKNVTTLKCDYAAPSERGTMRQNIPKSPTAWQVKYDISQSNFFFIFLFPSQTKPENAAAVFLCTVMPVCHVRPPWQWLTSWSSKVYAWETHINLSKSLGRWSHQTSTSWGNCWSMRRKRETARVRKENVSLKGRG